MAAMPVTYRLCPSPIACARPAGSVTPAGIRRAGVRGEGLPTIPRLSRRSPACRSSRRWCSPAAPAPACEIPGTGLAAGLRYPSRGL